MIFLINRKSALAFVGILFGCLGGDDKGGAGASSLTMNFLIEVLSIDRPNGTITTRTTQYQCEDAYGMPVATAILVHDTSVDNFQISGGTLVVWNEVDCDAMQLTGASTDIVGTWTGTGVSSSGPIPAGISHTCIPDSINSGGEMMDSMFTDFQATYQISSTQITGTATGSLCVMQIMESALTETMPTGASISRVGCDRINISYQGESMAISSSVNNGGMSMTMTSGGTSCTSRSYFDSPGSPMPDCAARHAEEAAYETCMNGLSPVPALAPMAKAMAKHASSLR